MKPQIINIVNFVRGVEPRDPQLDLVEPVRRQVDILRKNELTATFLLQYDAMIRGDIVEIFKEETDTPFEIGIWLEVVQPLVEKAGIQWRGRPGFSWDWHVNAGFTIGYTPEERKKMIDTFMQEFQAVFGHYPHSAGSWLIDAESLAYLSEKYGIEAFCNCRDQWGTDGYTLWGGYYGQGYYPSRINSFVPAQNQKNQINVPVFRMLGSDPIYQYSAGLDENFNPCDWQDVQTLEPISEKTGGSPDWVRWFFRENFNGLCLSFGYAQAGQENSFGWDAMRSGIEDQFGLIAELSAKGKLNVMTLSQTGKWYKARYSTTPASSIAALSDWSGAGNRSVWYCSRFYRANILWGKGKLHIRDIHLFSEKYQETFLDSRCNTPGCTYDTLPLMDGNRWSGNNLQAGVFPVEETLEALEGGEARVEETGDESLAIVWPLKKGGVMRIDCCPQTLEISVCDDINKDGWSLAFTAGNTEDLPELDIRDASIILRHNGFNYQVHAEIGSFFKGGQGSPVLIAKPQNNRIRLNFGRLTE